MFEQIKKQEEKIIDSISSLKSIKNPINIFFVLTELKEIFLSTAETLLNSIEWNYSKNTRNEYLCILDKYREEWIFESLYNYYIHNHWMSKFKQAIDDYFEYSFFTDISFFYYTLSRDLKYQMLFLALEKIFFDKEIRQKYFTFDNYLDKNQYLQEILPEIKNIKYNKDTYFIINFLNHFSEFNFWAKINWYVNWWNSEIKLMKNITLYILKQSKKYQKLYDLIIDTFVNDNKIYDNTIEHFEEKKLFEVISFLRNDLISWINTQTVLSFSDKNFVKNFIKKAENIWWFSIDQKVELLFYKEDFLKNIQKSNQKFVRLIVKRKLLEKKYTEIIDFTLWITALPQDIFYLFKQKNFDIKLEKLQLFNEIKNLILFIDNSFFLNIARPFLLKKISYYFNNSDWKYYIIKFILCVILSSSYSEYKKISKFFYNLETFSWTSKEAFLWRILQFWWIYLILILLFFLAPFWVLVAWIILFLREWFMKIISKINPKIKMNFNFQLWSFASIFASLALIIWWSAWYKDNIYWVYENFKSGINALILPANQSLALIAWELSFLKADLLWIPKDENKTIISLKDIDYTKSQSLYDLKKQKSFSWQIIENNLEKNDDIEKQIDIFISQKQEQQSKYKNVIINKNNTFWDYWIEISHKCWKNTKDKKFQAKLYQNIEFFLKQNKIELLSYISTQNQRLSVWSIASRLPEIEYDLSWLEKIICE